MGKSNKDNTEEVIVDTVIDTNSNTDINNEFDRETLTPEEEQKIVDCWNSSKTPPDIKTLVNLIAPGYDARSKIGKAVRAVCVKRSMGARTTKYERIDGIILNDAQKEFIKNNYGGSCGTPFEIAKILWSDRKIEPLGLEVRAVNEYVNLLMSEGELKKKDTDTPDGDYVPPHKFHHVMAKINTCLQLELSLGGMNAQEKKSIESITKVLQSPRFLQMINSYVSIRSRKMFEEEFIRTMWDKATDSTVDEVNLCLNLCANYVMMVNVNKELDMLRDRFQREIMDEGSKVSQALAEMVKAKSSEYAQLDVRAQKLVSELNGSRSDRVKNQVARNASVVNLIEYFKEEENRKTMLRITEDKRRLIKDEVERIATVDDIIAIIGGVTQNELLNG